MIPLATSYLRQFAGLVTVWQERYKADVLFRSTVGVVTLLLGFAAASLIVFSVITTQQASIWIALLAMVATGSIFGFLFFKLMLQPTRNTLHYQKLFISNVAHELRTPLSTIKTSAEVALLDPTMSTPTKQIFGEIGVELDRISEIINNLLSLNTLVRPERMRFSSVDLSPLVDAVYKRLQPLARERRVSVTIRKDGPLLVWGNAVGLEQVLANLIKNAVMYTQKNGSGVVNVSIHPDYQGSVVFSVSDNGIGIAQSDLAHVFEPFYRADLSRVRAVKQVGSGLGLSIVNEIVRMHHGKINIESARSHGTTVSVVLPVVSTKQVAPDINKKNPRNHLSVDFSSKLAGIFQK